MAVTLLQLRTRARRRVEMESTDFIVDAELTDLVNESYTELWEEVALHDPDRFVVTNDFTVVGGTEALSTLTLSGSMLAVTEVQKDPDTANRRPIGRFSRRNPPLAGVSVAGLDPSYRVEGEVIVLEPYEAAAGDYRVRSIARPTLLSVDASTMDGRLERWDEYVTLRTAIKMLNKEESDSQPIWQEFNLVRARVIAWACKRDRVSPMVVPDPPDECW